MTAKIYKKQLLTIVASACLLMAASAHADNNTLQPLSHIYSNADLELRLALTPNVQVCQAEACTNNELFNERIQAVGERLKLAAYERFPDEQSYPEFEFEVAEKAELGTASNAKGKIVVYRNMQTLQLSDAALSFIMAREMAHVLAKHNSKNASTKLWITAIASIAFPAVALIHASTAAQVSTASSIISSVGSSVTTAVGNKVAMQSVKPAQLAEADEIAYNICEQQQFDLLAITQEIKLASNSQTNTWAKDLQKTQLSLEKRLMRNVALAQ